MLPTSSLPLSLSSLFLLLLFSFGGEAGCFGGEASPLSPPIDRTLQLFLALRYLNGRILQVLECWVASKPESHENLILERVQSAKLVTLFSYRICSSAPPPFK